MIEVAEKDKAKMISTLNDTPPLTILYSGTSDQRSELWKIKQRNTVLRDKLKAYFSGQAELNTERLNCFDRESLEVEKDRLLSIYALIQGSWNELVLLAESAGVSMANAAIHTPGDWIAAYLEASTADAVERIMAGYYRWTPSASRKQAKALKDALALVETKTYSELKAPEKRKVDQVIATIEKSSKASHAAIPFNFLLNCCRELAKKAGAHSAIRRRLDAYHEVSARQMQLVTSELHPRKARKGFEMVKGQRRVMGSYGGVTSA